MASAWAASALSTKPFPHIILFIRSIYSIKKNKQWGLEMGEKYTGLFERIGKVNDY